MHRGYVLALAGWLNVAFAALYAGLSVLGAPTYHAFGGGLGSILHVHPGHLMPPALILCMAVAMAVFPWYAFAGAGFLRRPPLLRTGLAAIATIYTVRGLSLFPELAKYYGGWDTAVPRTLVFSLSCLTTGALYLVGTVLLWPRLKTQ